MPMNGCHSTTALTLVLFLLFGLWPSTAQGLAHRRKWHLLPADRHRLECGSPFHDIQSKWLQSPVVLRALDWLTEASAGGDERSHRFNITVSIQSVLKSPESMKFPNSTRITIGEFSGALSRRQMHRQRRSCTPSRLERSQRGYIFFLTPTDSPGFFRHKFLPVKYRPKCQKKFNRVSCKHPSKCPKSPWIFKAVPHGVTPHQDSREISMRFVCAAKGEPAPIVRWYKDGIELALTERVRAQFKKRLRKTVSRLTVRPVKVTDAGSYTCEFTNMQGSVNATFDIEVAKILRANRQLEKRSSADMARAYVCNSANYTHCRNNGTCIINSSDGKPHCLCPSTHTGLRCEKQDI